MRLRYISSVRFSLKMAGVRKVNISDLGPGVNDIMMVAVMIAKQTPRTIASKRNPGTDRTVWSFTIRDSPFDFINASLWGTKDYVNDLAKTFHTGDIVEIINAKVNFRQPSDADEKFNPSVTSPFQLSLSEGFSTIQLQSYMAEDENEEYEKLNQLLRLPTKAPSCFLTISDILSNGISMKGEFVDLLVAISNVGSVKVIKTKDGREVECREIVVMDQTSSNMPIQIWDPDLIVQAGSWRPRETVLFLADMRIIWNAFRKSVGVSVCSRTIITENPETGEANILRTYARTAPIAPTAILDHIASTIPDAAAIHNVMSVQQVIRKAMGENSSEQGIAFMTTSNSDNSQFTALVYCFLTEFDLDGVSRTILERCSKCQVPIKPSLPGMCPNIECPVGSGSLYSEPEMVFDLRITLTDHTGSLSGCRLVGQNAEKVIGCKVSRFNELTLDEKTSLKWRLLLERCAARILVFKSTPQRRNPLVSLLSCEPADPVEVSTRCPRW